MASIVTTGHTKAFNEIFMNSSWKNHSTTMTVPIKELNDILRPIPYCFMATGCQHLYRVSDSVCWKMVCYFANTFSWLQLMYSLSVSLLTTVVMVI